LQGDNQSRELLAAAKKGLYFTATEARSTPVNDSGICWKVTVYADQWAIGNCSCVALLPASMQSLDNAVVERFFGSLKHDWIFKVAPPTRDHMKSDVAAYIK
jgi:hypothetical protein